MFALVAYNDNVFCDDLDPRLSWDQNTNRAMRSPDSMEPKKGSQHKGENWSPV